MQVDLPPFYVGQTVVGKHPNQHGFPLVGHKYLVLGVERSQCCGIWQISVNHLTEHLIKTCFFCHTDRYNDNSYAAFRFAPIKESLFPNLKLSQIREKELEKVDGERLGEN